jgi:hypothetical protein
MATKTKVPLPWTTQQPDPGPHPQANGDATSGADHVAWLNADRAAKESMPQNVSDGGKGVSN